MAIALVLLGFLLGALSLRLTSSGLLALCAAGVPLTGLFFGRIFC